MKRGELVVPLTTTWEMGQMWRIARSSGGMSWPVAGTLPKMVS